MAATAYGLRQLPGMATFSPMILAILIGIAFHNLVGTPAIARPGVTFSLRRLLRIAIILLGLQLTITQVIEVGGRGIGIIAATLLATFAFTVWMGQAAWRRPQARAVDRGRNLDLRRLGGHRHQHRDQRAMTRTSPMRSPASPCSGRSRCSPIRCCRDCCISIRTASDCGAGASIHEIAQVVAAAFQDGQKAGEFGTIAKLSRVMLLAPVVIALGLIATRSAGSNAPAAGASSARPPMPWFVLGFVALVGVNSVVTIPAEAKVWIAAATTFLLSVALAAMGLETDIRKLTAKGLRPALLGALAFLFIAGFSLDADQIDRITHMTLEQLRIFIAVAEKQHVTQAASELNLTQSATSAAIAALEARYGIKLFDRVGRGIVLTQTGRDFLVEARAVLARAKAAAQVLNDLAGLKRGSLTIAASQTVANYWLPRPDPDLSLAPIPASSCALAIANTEQVARAVHEGSADLGFVEGEVDDASLADHARSTAIRSSWWWE